MAASPCVATPEEFAPEKKKIMKAREPKQKPVEPKAQGRDLLAEIFAGHEEFLGWTPE